MDKSLGQLLISAILGAIAAEILREKKPELFDEIEKNTKDIAKDLKNIYKQINTTIRDWAENIS